MIFRIGYCTFSIEYSNTVYYLYLYPLQCLHLWCNSPTRNSVKVKEFTPCCRNILANQIIRQHIGQSEVPLINIIQTHTGSRLPATIPSNTRTRPIWHLSTPATIKSWIFSNSFVCSVIYSSRVGDDLTLSELRTISCMDYQDCKCELCNQVKTGGSPHSPHNQLCVECFWTYFHWIYSVYIVRC